MKQRLYQVFRRVRQDLRALFHSRDYRTYYFQCYPRLRPYRNRHAGEDCFVVGNGPSLRKMDLEALNDFHVFGQNKLHLLLETVPLELSYLVAVNDLVIQQSQREFEHQIKCPKFLSYRGGFPFLRHRADTQFLFTGGDLGFSRDLLDPIWEGFTVTYVTLQLAYFMGFRRVFLIGVDHNFAFQGRPNEAQTLQGEDPNHFDPRYFSGHNWHLPDLEGSELAYRIARFQYERDERSIFDATVDGKLNIFPKVTYHQALAEAKPKRQHGRFRVL